MSETELESERDHTRDEIADQLETFANNLRGDGPVELTVGDTTVTVKPPQTVEFEVEVEDEGEIIGDDVERSIEFELEWMAQEDEEELPAQ